MKSFAIALLPLLGFLTNSVMSTPIASTMEMDKRAIPGGILTKQDVVERRHGRNGLGY
jgi:hypothetical protein